MLHALEDETGKHFLFEGSEGLPLDHFEVVMEGAPRRGRASAAMPFRDGDEVLVTIVEPHMYEVDDAVAKIDGYIISVAGGGALVGEKRLVRIEEAGRTSAARRVASASPTAPARPPRDGEADGDDAVESKPRRRGRRGGRRRSAAKAEADPAD